MTGQAAMARCQPERTVALLPVKAQGNRGPLLSVSDDGGAKSIIIAHTAEEG